MDRRKEESGECRMDETDSRGKSNLCCCYMIDENGAYDDPCYHPVETCCSGGIHIAGKEREGAADN